VHLRRLTGIVLILTPIAFNVFFTLLSVTFEYPDILREPTGYVLRHFDAGGSALVAIWYGFMLTAVLFVPLAVLVHKVLARGHPLHGGGNRLRRRRRGGAVPRPGSLALLGPLPGEHLPRSGIERGHPRVGCSGPRWSRWPCSGRRYRSGSGWAFWGWYRLPAYSSAPLSLPGSGQPQTSWWSGTSCGRSGSPYSAYSSCCFPVFLVLPVLMPLCNSGDLVLGRRRRVWDDTKNPARDTRRLS
jgi:hypothetical protein